MRPIFSDYKSPIAMEATMQFQQTEPTLGHHDFLADAHAIVSDPAQYHNRPILRRMAWVTLMTARGKTVNQTRLAQMPVECAMSAVGYDAAAKRLKAGETITYCNAVGTEDKPRITLSKGGTITRNTFSRLCENLEPISDALFDGFTPQQMRWIEGGKQPSHEELGCAQ